MASFQDITNELENILSKDWTAVRKKELEEVFVNMKTHYEQLPLQIRSDIASILKLISSLKDDNVSLWTECCEMKGTIAALTKEVKQLKEAITKLQATADAMCMRQAVFAVQEKLLREIGGSRISELWRNHFVSTLNDLAKLFQNKKIPPYFEEQWVKVQNKYGIKYDIDTLHRMIKVISKHGNVIVHDTGFEHCSYEELIAMIEKNVDADYLDAWKAVAGINKSLSEARNEDLFTYNNFSTLAD